MKKLMIGIFAHPDDEAFGPSGTLLKLHNEGYDIHLILLTDGEGGTNPDNVPFLGSTRLGEWQSAAKLLGARTVTALHYPDGGLSLITNEDLDTKVNHHISRILADYRSPAHLSFMSFEPLGITGHRDHIAASHLTARMMRQFGAHEAWYFCLNSNQAPLSNTAYYEPRAREDSYITHRIDVNSFLTDKYRIVDAHHSQRTDGTNLKALGEERLSVECFHIETY